MSPRGPRRPPRRAGTRRDARLYRPRPISVELAGEGVPVGVAGTPVEAIREEWLVEDRWWTSRPLRRRYYELVLEDGRCAVVFHDLERDDWFGQRA